MSPQQAVDNFVATNVGLYIDEDRAYGSQCWDVSAKYARVEWQCPFLPTGSGGAEGLYRLFQNPIPQYFDKVSRDQLQPGDIVVWSASFYPPYGHTAVLWKREGSTMFVLEQDGSKDPNGDGIADGVSYIAQRPITSFVAGGLRPKGGNEMVTKEAYLVGAEAVGTVLGKDFNYDPNISNDQFAQFLLGQAPRITKEMESEIADNISGVQGFIGWDGYNSQFVGRLVVSNIRQMVLYWTKYVASMPKGEYVEVPGPLFKKK